MKSDRLDEIMEYQKERPNFHYLWTIPVWKFIRAYDIEPEKKHTCHWCNKPAKPLLGFHFQAEDGENVIGYNFGHLECCRKNNSGLSAVMVHTDVDSKFNQMIQGLFADLKSLKKAPKYKSWKSK